jgi:streptogramin lyase
VAAGLGYVWVASDDRTVIRFDPESGAEVGAPIRVGRDPTAIAIGEGAVWVAASGEGAIYRITP